MQRCVYIVFSATPYKMGKFIRKATGQTYNHVSITTAEDCSHMYSFARRYYRTPLYGGFVQETPSRYYVKGKVTNICICKLPISETQYESLNARLATMAADQNRYLYNHLSAMGTLVQKPIKVIDAYTCVEFCVSILHDLGVDLDPEKYYTIDDVLQVLRDGMIYTGPMPTGGEVDTAYFAKKPTPHPAWNTLRDLIKLIPRHYK